MTSTQGVKNGESEMKCPVCNKAVHSYQSKLHDGTIVEEGCNCGKCCYYYSQSYGSYFLQISRHRWGWAYETPKPTEAINAAIAEAKARREEGDDKMSEAEILSTRKIGN